MKEKTILPRLIANGRITLLFMIVLTFLNIILYYMHSTISFPYSAFIPYFAVIFGDYLSSLNATMSYFYILNGIAIAFLAVYIIAWFASRKKSGWFIVITIFYVLDTVFMGYFLWETSIVNLLINLGLHGIIIYSFARAMIFHIHEKKRLKTQIGMNEVISEVSDTKS